MGCRDVSAHMQQHPSSAGRIVSTTSSKLTHDNDVLLLHQLIIIVCASACSVLSYDFLLLLLFLFRPSCERETGVCSGKYDILQRMISILIVVGSSGRKAVSSVKTARQRAEDLLLSDGKKRLLLHGTAPSHYHAIIMQGWMAEER